MCARPWLLDGLPSVSKPRVGEWRGAETAPLPIELQTLLGSSRLSLHLRPRPPGAGRDPRKFKGLQPAVLRLTPACRPRSEHGKRGPPFCALSAQTMRRGNCCLGTKIGATAQISEGRRRSLRSLEGCFLRAILGDGVSDERPSIRQSASDEIGRARDDRGGRPARELLPGFTRRWLLHDRVLIGEPSEVTNEILCLHPPFAKVLDCDGYALWRNDF